MRRFVVAVPKRVGVGLVQLLWLTKACKPSAIRAKVIDWQMFVQMPDTRATRAVWLAYIYGKKCGYWMGCDYPPGGEIFFPYKTSKRTK